MLRSDTATWQRSAHATILVEEHHPDAASERTWSAVAALTFDGSDADPVVTGPAHERHHRQVRATVPRHRLVHHRPGGGWGPLCSVLGLDEPDEPLPHVNSSEQFRDRRRVRRDERS